MGGFAWVTLATNDSYSLGALVLAHSLRRVGSQHDLAVLITPGVTQSMREKLATVFTLVREVNVLDSKDEANLAVLQRPELGITFTKLHCWRLTQYDKCVFIDADALVVRNCDELFEREELSAAPDVGWPDCFNSGVFVFKASQQTFASLTAFAASQGSFDGADQGLLNMFFSDWAHKDISKHLPFIYNMCSTATYSYAPAFKQYGENVRIVHFIGATKPWLQYFDTLTGIVQPPPACNHLQPLLQIWWNIFWDNVHSQLTDVMGGLAGSLSKLTLGESRSDEQQAIEDHMRKQNWEQGYIDFMGRDSFDNILKKINETLASAPPRQPSPPKETRQPEKSDSKSSEVEAAVDESEAALPVLATEGQAETGTAQGSLEEKCQRISSSEVAPSQIESSSITATSEADNTSGVNISDSTQQILESTEKLVPSLQSIDVPDTTTQSQSEIPLEPQAQAQITLDVKETEAIAPELAIETKVSQENKQVVETEPVIIEKVAENVSEASIDNAISPSRPVESASEVSTVLSSVPSASVETKPVETSVQIQQATAQVVSEATTECPVPIQVAESVLQTVPKESVSEDPRPIVETVVSSIIPPVQESAAAVSETLIEPGRTAPADPIVHPQQLNGDDPSLQLEVERVFAPSVTSTALVSRSPNVVSVVHEFSPRGPQETPVAEVSESQQQGEQLPKQENNLSAPTPAEVPTSSVSEQDKAPASQKSSLSVKLPQSETTEKVTDESPVLTSDPQKTTTSDPAEVLPTDSVLQEEGPLRPNRSKDLKIPSTPIVIEATPPSSPPLDEEALKAAQLEQAQKKAQPETEAQVQSETQIQAEVDSQSTKIQTETATEVKTEAQPESKAETQSKQQSEAQPEQQTEVQVEQQAVLDPIPHAGAQAEQQAEAKSEQQAESQQTTKKVVKKLVKKSSGESDSPSSPESEGPGKKVVKKVVKKVTKKPKEGKEAEGSSSAEKPKKVVKTVKKVAKTSSSTSLETDKTVPETPPPSASSEVPVPPKRKPKSTSSVKGADKKPAES